MDNLDVVKQYLASIEQGRPFEEVSRFFTEDAVQREFPNRLVPNGATRGLAEMQEAAARGRKVMTAQRYDIQSAVAAGDRVALEVRWTGTLAVPFGSIPAGGEMAASFAVFFEMRDGNATTTMFDLNALLSTLVRSGATWRHYVGSCTRCDRPTRGRVWLRAKRLARRVPHRVLP